MPTTASLSPEQGSSPLPHAREVNVSEKTRNGIEGKEGRKDQCKGRDSIQEVNAWRTVGGAASVLLGAGAGSSTIEEDCEEKDGRGTKKTKRRKGQGSLDGKEGKEVKRRKGGADGGASKLTSEAKRGKMTQKVPFAKEGTPGGSTASTLVADEERSGSGSSKATGRRKRREVQAGKIVEREVAVQEIEDGREMSWKRCASPVVDTYSDPIPTETLTVELNEMIVERELDAAVSTPNPFRAYELPPDASFKWIGNIKALNYRTGEEKAGG